MLIKSKTDRAWLACFLDTDGSVYIRTYKSKKGIAYNYPMAALYNSNKEILEKAKSILAGSIIFHYREGVDKRNIKRGNNFSFVFSRTILKQALKELLPYLIDKKEKTEKLLMNWR